MNMETSSYDTIIIGSGISGLICGCYLAKAGVKTLIVEQHDKVGGYCTSFEKNGYTFDAGVHYLGGIKNGLLGKILSELNLTEDYIKFNRFDPSDKIIMPDTTTYIRTNPQETVENFQDNFPDEKKNIEDFFKYVLEDNLLNSYSKLKKFTFKDILDKYFQDNKLKGTLSMLLGNIGLPASRITAITALMLFKEFILDSGYYPETAMQSFPEVLAERFIDLGGKVMLSGKAETITTKNKKTSGVSVNGKVFASETLISNADATETFQHLLDTKETPEYQTVKKLLPSPSVFALYLGLNTDLNNLLKEPCNIWYSNTYDTEILYSHPKKNITDAELPCLMASVSSMHSNRTNKSKGCITALTTAEYESKSFWDQEKGALQDKMLKILKKLIPDIENHIGTTLTATPLTFERYTSNKQGAAYGWAPTPQQADSSLIPQETSIEGLYLTGHWCTKGMGTGCISGAASLGRNAAKIVLENKGQKWNYPILLRK